VRLRARRFVSSSRIRYFFVLREKIRADSRWTRETRATHAVRRYARDKYGHLYIHDDDDDDIKTLFRDDVLRAMMMIIIIIIIIIYSNAPTPSIMHK